jgi:hypothetical protein
MSRSSHTLSFLKNADQDGLTSSQGRHCSGRLNFMSDSGMFLADVKYAHG